MFEKSGINQAVNSVYKSLQNRLIKTYGIMEVEEAEEKADDLWLSERLEKGHCDPGQRPKNRFF